MNVFLLFKKWSVSLGNIVNISLKNALNFCKHEKLPKLNSPFVFDLAIYQRPLSQKYPAPLHFLSYSTRCSWKRANKKLFQCHLVPYVALCDSKVTHLTGFSLTDWEIQIFLISYRKLYQQLGFTEFLSIKDNDFMHHSW